MAGSVRKRGASWHYVIDVGQGDDGKRLQRFRGGFRTRRDAENALREFENHRESGFLPDAANLTFRDYMKRWLEHHATQVEPKTWQRYEAISRLYLVPKLGSMPLQRIRPAHVQAALDEIDASPRTVQHVRGVASNAMRQAVAWQLIASNPVAATQAPKAVRPDLEVPSVEQARGIMAAASGTRWEIPVFLSVFTGARRGEVLAVRWRNADLSRGRIRIESSLERHEGEFRFKEPKTKRSRREIAIPPIAVDRLRRWRIEQGERRLAFGPSWHDLDLICEAGDGSPLDPDSFSKAFKRFAASVGIPSARLHDLRHAAATLMMEQGVHPSVVSRSLGHASEAFTMAVYGHVRDEMLDQAADALGQAYGD